MNHLDNWEKDLQRRFADHRIEPPAMGWERLESALQPATPHIPFWRRPAFYVPAASAAACLALVLLIDQPAEEIIPAQLATQTQTVATPTPSAAPAPLAAVPSQEATPKQTSPTAQKATASVQAQPALAQAVKATAMTTGAAEAMPIDDTKEAQPVTDAPAPSATPQSEAKAQKEVAEKRVRTAPKPKYTYRKEKRTLAYEPKRNKRHQPTIGLLGGFMPAERAVNEGYYTQAVMNYSRGTSNRPCHFICSPSNTDLMMLIAKNVNREVNTDVHHRTPVRFGVNVKVPLTARWSLGTGLTYTLLSTDIKSGSTESYFTTDLDLHYVGVPLQATYTLFQSRPFNAYATAGILVEKCVKGKSTTLFHLTDSYKSGTESADNLGRGLWQASIRLSAGMQFNLTRHIGLYFEPGASYFVPDHSSLPSIRHDKPWQFDMEAGLRITLGR